MSGYQEIMKEYPSVIGKEQLRLLLRISKRKVTFMLEQGFIPCVEKGERGRKYFIRVKDVVDYLEDVEEHPEKYVFARKLAVGNPAHQYMKKRPVEFSREEFERWLGEKWREVPERLTAQEIAGVTGYAEYTVERWFKEGRLKAVRLPGEVVSCKEWVMEFYVGEGYELARKSKEHIRLMEKFFETIG